MTCKLLRNIRHSSDYNPGGITDIYLLDIRDLKAYQFADDGLFDTCYVDRIKTQEPFIELGTVNESAFTESYENGVYKQELTTFVRTLSAQKLSDLLLSKANKYLIAFRTSLGTVHSFGSDGGASLSFTQISGQLGETSGYQITISKSSVYPLFEVNADKFNKVLVLGTENKILVSSEDKQHTILI